MGGIGIPGGGAKPAAKRRRHNLVALKNPRNTACSLSFMILTAGTSSSNLANKAARTAFRAAAICSSVYANWSGAFTRIARNFPAKAGRKILL